MPRGVADAFSRSLRLVIVSLLTLLASGCASGGAGLATRGRSSSGAVEPWKIPAAAYPTQRLYRVRYDGPDGNLRFKLTLYLESEERFRMRAADALGRKVWELGIDQDDRALWLDHRNKKFCHAEVAGEVAAVPLARLPLAALPRLLLGYLPRSPASDLERTEVTISFRDASGELWNGGLADGRLEWWTLLGEAREPVTWWRREGEESIFVDVRGRQQLRWREVVSEPLEDPLGPLPLPEKYMSVDCG